MQIYEVTIREPGRPEVVARYDNLAKAEAFAEDWLYGADTSVARETEIRIEGKEVQS